MGKRDRLRAENERLVARNQEIEKKMTMRDKLKRIFKKYGFTAFAVLSAVGVVIGVIVSNLKNGLTTLGKVVGNGLKDIGKKLGQILPGMIGSIASFTFKTAGEVIGFLGKHAWLWIVTLEMMIGRAWLAQLVRFLPSDHKVPSSIPGSAEI